MKAVKNTTAILLENTAQFTKILLSFSFKGPCNFLFLCSGIVVGFLLSCSIAQAARGFAFLIFFLAQKEGLALLTP
jgi:hypothetical protein